MSNFDSVNNSLFIIVNLVRNNFLHILCLGDNNLLDSWFLFIRKVSFKIYPFTHTNPNFTIILSILYLLLNFQKNLVTCSDWVIKVRETAYSWRLSFFYKFVNIFCFHWLVNGRIILFMINICSINVFN